MILFWIVAGLIFIKCLSWVLAPFKQEPDQYHEHHYNHYSNVDIDITDSFNTDNSYFKGGAYHGTKEENTNQTSDDYDFGKQYRRRY